MRHKLALLLLTVLLALPACRTPGPPYGAPDPVAARLYGEALAAQRRGNGEECLRLLKESLRIEPRYVPAHRAYQNQLSGACLRLELFRDYGRRAAVSGDDAVWLYLYGRLHQDLGERENLFRESLGQGPDFAYAHYGLGFGLEQKMDPEGALLSYKRAEELLPDEPLFILRTAACLRKLGRNAEADLAYRAALMLDPLDAEPRIGLALVARDEGKFDHMVAELAAACALAPRDASVLATAGRLALDHASRSQLRSLLFALDGVSQDVDTGELWLLRGRLHAALGDPSAASLALSRARGRLANQGLMAVDLRRQLFQLGRYRKAWSIHAERIAGGLLEAEDNRVREVYSDLARAVETATGGTGKDLLVLAAACERAGWLEEALAVYSGLLLDDGANLLAQQGLERTRSLLRFLDELRRRFDEIYEAHGEGRPVPDLKVVAEDVVNLVRDELGIECGELEFRTFSPLGEVWSSSLFPASPLARRLAECNLYAVLGHRIGGPPELQISTLASFRPRLSGSAFGWDARYDEVACIDSWVPSYLAFRGEAVAGVAIVDTVVLDLDVLWGWTAGTAAAAARWGQTPEQVKSAGGFPAASRRERLAVTEDLCLGERLAWEEGCASMPKDDLFRFLLGHVRRHEFGHVVDAVQYLPVGGHLLRVISLLVSKGFSAQAIQEHLEGSAEILALAESDNPRLALSFLVSGARPSGGEGPHAEGYRAALSRMVRIVDDDPGRFPEIDRNANILQQLHRLSARDLQHLAREVARERY